MVSITKYYCEVCGECIGEDRDNSAYVDIAFYSPIKYYINTRVCNKCYGKLTMDINEKIIPILKRYNNELTEKQIKTMLAKKKVISGE